MMSKKSPQLRFEGFTDDWEERKLGEISKTTIGEFVIKTKQSDESPYPVYNGGRSYTGKYDEYNNDGPKIVISARGANAGFVNYVSGRYWAGNSCYSVSVIKEDEFSIGYLYQFIKYNQVLFTAYQQAANIPSVSKSDVEKFSIKYPTVLEQKKIESFFKQLDNTIALHQRKLDLLKEQKKGYLQKMFPKNGAKVPELRFEGFADDWEQRKLGEFSDVRDGTHASPKYVSQGHPMVTSKNLTHSGLDMTDVSFLTDEDFNEINKRSKVSIGDILFGMIGTIGNPVIVDRDDFAIKNVALIKEKTSNPITNKWLLQYLKSPSFNRFIQKENAGGTQKFIALGLIRDMKLRVPEFDEQQKIGAFFKKIDDTIALHQRKLDLLKEQKKGFLQKMFV